MDKITFQSHAECLTNFAALCASKDNVKKEQIIAAQEVAQNAINAFGEALQQRNFKGLQRSDLIKLKEQIQQLENLSPTILKTATTINAISEILIGNERFHQETISLFMADLITNRSPEEFRSCLKDKIFGEMKGLTGDVGLSLADIQGKLLGVTVVFQNEQAAIREISKELHDREPSDDNFAKFMQEDEKLDKITCILNLLQGPALTRLIRPLEMRVGHEILVQPSVRGQLDQIMLDKPDSITAAGKSEISVETLRQERMWRLTHLHDVYQHMIHSEESSQVQTKFFPLTTAWYVGGLKNIAREQFELEMATIGQPYGIRIVCDGSESAAALRQRPNGLVFDDAQKAVFPQDCFELCCHEIRVPYVPQEERKIEINTIVKDSRKQRFEEGYLAHNRAGHTSTHSRRANTMDCISKVYAEDLHLKGIHLAQALGVCCSMNLTYNEGGNSLIGTTKDGRPAIIIGKDTVAASKVLIESDLGRNLSEDEIRMAFAVDYGVPMDSIFFVEQPGDFHLDMCMAFAGPGIILLNNAIEAHTNFVAEMNRLLEEQVVEDKDSVINASLYAAEIKSTFELRVQDELTQQGFEVYRVPGIYNYFGPFAQAPAMNFFNMVTATTLEGERIIVAMGCINEKFQRECEDLYHGFIGPTRIYFLNKEDSLSSLEQGGGISCRAKTFY